MSFLYLASPYTHSNPRVRELRFIAACQKAARLMLEGHVVFCPIAHSHPIAEQMPPGMAVDGPFWKAQDAPYIVACKEFYVLQLPGWLDSKGLTHELERVRARGIPVTFVEPVHHELCGDPLGCHPDCIVMKLRDAEYERA